jgi:hypothetical protein
LLPADRRTTDQRKDGGVQYMILAMEHPSAFDSRESDGAEEYWSAWSGYIRALTESGVLTSAGGLQPPSAANTVRLRDGRRMLQDGPFADTKEQLGGYFVIDVADLAAALEWAERCPSAFDGAVEVRPLLPPMAE